MSTLTSVSRNHTSHLENVEKTSKTFTLPLPHNTSVLEKVTDTTTYNIHSSEQPLPCYIRTKLAQLRGDKSPLLVSYLHAVNPKTYTSKCPLCLLHTHMTLITSLTVIKYQHNTTPLVCGKNFW